MAKKSAIKKAAEAREGTLGDAAIVIFMSALASTIEDIDGMKPEKRTTENIVRHFDSKLSDLVVSAELDDGIDARENVFLLRKAFAKARDYSKLLRASDGIAH